MMVMQKTSNEEFKIPYQGTLYNERYKFGIVVIFTGIISFGIIFPDIFIKKSVKYSVIPIGMRTTMPAIKLFLNLEKIDFFKF